MISTLAGQYTEIHKLPSSRISNSRVDHITKSQT